MKDFPSQKKKRQVRKEFEHKIATPFTCRFALKPDPYTKILTSMYKQWSEDLYILLLKLHPKPSYTPKHQHMSNTSWLFIFSEIIHIQSSCLILQLPSTTNCSRFVVNNKNFVQVTKEEICKFNMLRVRNILCNAFSAIERGLEDMSETLMQVLYAHVLAPEASFSIYLRYQKKPIQCMYKILWSFSSTEQIFVAFIRDVHLCWLLKVAMQRMIICNRSIGPIKSRLYGS